MDFNYYGFRVDWWWDEKYLENMSVRDMIFCIWFFICLIYNIFCMMRIVEILCWDIVFYNGLRFFIFGWILDFIFFISFRKKRNKWIRKKKEINR